MSTLRFVCLSICLFAFVGTIFAQTSNGTITGTVTDATGAVVVSASVEARNIDTGVVYPTKSTQTGNYVINNVPIGRYEISVTEQGFKKYSRQGLTLAASQIMRIDVPLEVGANTEAVTVTAEASLLKTESGEMVHNVTAAQLQELPIMVVGGAGQASTSGFRDPFALVKLIPGTFYGGASSALGISANGNNDSSIRVEGQVAGNLGGGSAAGGFFKNYTAETQPSVDAVQEVAVQTSNYAAEFGDAGGPIMNLTMKSGGNQYHGSLYDYDVNEILNAAPSMHTTNKNATRRHDYGMTFGGPVSIPKIYDGRNKTFFFWSWEQFRENIKVNPGTGGAALATVPIDPYRVGDFQHVIDASNCTTGGVLGPCAITVAGKPYVNALGGTGFVAGQIFDPFSTQAVTCPSNGGKAGGPNCTPGVTDFVRLPFPSVACADGVTTVNCLPATAAYRDPVALNLQKLFPKPLGPNANNTTAFGNNFQNPWLSHRTSQIPSIKVDNSIGSRGHLSVYWSNTETESQYSFPLGGYEGFPAPITAARGTFIYGKTDRVNYDHTITPSLLLHLGAGWNQLLFDDHNPVAVNGGYDACLPFTTLEAAQTKGGLGLCGALQNRTFPAVNIGASATAGGMSGISTTGQSATREQRPSGNANFTYVKGNHNYKVGAEFRLENYPNQTFGADGSYTFAGTQTGQPSTADAGGALVTNNSTGFGYASFLMGWPSAVSLTFPPSYTTSRQVWGLFLQDTWKVTRKLTLDYGLRWDFGTYVKEVAGREASLSTTLANPAAGNHPGAAIFEATCGCSFVPNNYPYALGPRIGFAYQIDRKTVFRGGFGLVYQTPGSTGGVSGVTLSSPPAAIPGDPVSQFSNGVTALHPVWPVFGPDAGFTPGSVGNAPFLPSSSFMRPPKLYQFSAGIQREIHRNLVLEASYVGNRGYWMNAGGLAPVNTISPDLLSQYGFAVPTNGVVTQADLDSRTLLRQTLSGETAAQNSALASMGVGMLVPGCAPFKIGSTAPLCASVPYATYPTNRNVSQTLVPFPQYNAFSLSNSPLGFTWYDSLQLVATQRLTHGLTFNTNFTYSKTQSATSSPLDPYNTDLAKGLAGSDQPMLFRVSADYTTPKIHSGNKILGNKVLSYALSDWGIGTYLQYASAPVMSRPNNSATGYGLASSNPYASCNSTTKTGLKSGTTNQCADPSQSVCPYNVVAGTTALGCTNPLSDWLGYGTGGMQLRTDPTTGQPMNPWSVDWTDNGGVHHTDPLDINCRCFDPTKTVVLNPNAWVSTPAGAFTADTSVLRDFRGIRAPSESLNVSRVFRLKERVSLQIRVEFQNVFNRLQLSNPQNGTGIQPSITSNLTVNNGLNTNGFGTFGNISPLTNGTSPGTPRSGTFVARLQF